MSVDLCILDGEDLVVFEDAIRSCRAGARVILVGAGKSLRDAGYCPILIRRRTRI